MVTPDDSTPPDGLPAIEDETPTSPALPHAHVRCFTCLGEGLVLSVVERDAHGIAIRRRADVCVTCRGTKTVSRAAWLAWRAEKEGRAR